MAYCGLYGPPGHLIDKNERETPDDFFQRLNAEFSFTLDPCCLAHTAKCSKFYTPSEDGLTQDWSDERVFMNPPYDNIYTWLMKAVTSSAEIIVVLLPANTGTYWFHDLVLPIADEIRFVRGHLRFNGPDKPVAPFASIVVIYRFDGQEVELTSCESC